MDIRLGIIGKLEAEGFTEVKGFESRSRETMSLQEWASFRQNEISGVTQDRGKEVGEWEAWLTLLAGKEKRQFDLFQNLSRILQGKKRIVDVGSGNAFASVLLATQGFSVEFVDPDTSVLVARLEPFCHAFKSLDVNDISSRDLKHRDAVIAIQLDYMLEKEKLLRLMRVTAGSGCALVLVTTQLIGPIQYLKERIRKAKLLDRNQIKKHGYLRSLALMQELGKSAGFKSLKYESPHKKRDSGTYWYLIFEP